MAVNDFFNRGEIENATSAMSRERKIQEFMPIGGVEGARDEAQATMFQVRQKCTILVVKSLGKEQVSGNAWLVKLALDGECDELKARSACTALEERGNGFTRMWKGKANEFKIAVAQSSEGGYYTTLDDLRWLGSELAIALGSPYQCPTVESFTGKAEPSTRNTFADDLLRDAESGNPEAQYDLALMYYAGEHRPKNVTEALKWFRQAADQGNTDAQLMLGLVYYTLRTDGDVGTPKDETEAVKWLRLAANRGDSIAQLTLGEIYFDGFFSISKDQNEAAKWLRLAADQGNDNGKLLLGILHSYGRGVPRDLDIAKSLWLEASDSDDKSTSAAALYNIGEIYFAGEEFGGTLDVTRAKVYWEKTLNSSESTDQVYKAAAAGLQCIAEEKPSTQCKPLRCSIEGRDDCLDL